MAEETGSEFGKGLCYCLGLFVAHSERKWPGATDTDFMKDHVWEMWFNGAADHLFEFMPECAPKHLQQRCYELQDKCLGWRLCIDEACLATEDDAKWAIEEAKELLREIDMWNGIPVVKARWD